MKAEQSVRIFLIGNGDLVDCFLDQGAGGGKLTRALKTLLTERVGPEFNVDVTRQSSVGSGALVSELEAVANLTEMPPDIVVLSLHADLVGAEHSMADGVQVASATESNLHTATNWIKERLRSHVIVLNACTIHPTNHVSNYHGGGSEPASLFAHRLNVALMRISHQEGISIVDADRILAEMGAESHLMGFLDYSPDAAAAICDELVRIIEDYGFLDERPLVMQLGRVP